MVPGAGRDCAFRGAVFASCVCSGRYCRRGVGIDPRFSIASDSARGKRIIPMPVPRLTDATTVACLFFIFLVPLAAAGLALMNVGLGRSRSAGHMMMASLSALAVAGLVYFVCGFAWQGFIGTPAHLLTLSGKNWNWIAAEPFFFRKIFLDGSARSL